MPQLSPLSWLMLYVFFWVLVALLSSVVWWWGHSKLECPHTKVVETAAWTWC